MSKRLFNFNAVGKQTRKVFFTFRWLIETVREARDFTSTPKKQIPLPSYKITAKSERCFSPPKKGYA
ncbi:hypothetical protein [Metalysinibacillus jejuensis]|uniref:hypothetical protein n=1 Tax=Metalysinibacillus jejuensis TaxID=914327 RepID=UPI0012908A27|nr:hypothetical protein [Metalysinibacillus jejuensis]